jgi:hypothetical protein
LDDKTVLWNYQAIGVCRFGGGEVEAWPARIDVEFRTSRRRAPTRQLAVECQVQRC